ncbi:unnamed protein product [Rhizoctonia solani]|uniref:DUF3074 domain-containing protein n=1 Tax=Rhizoctonia solani TaxID=456999 RepID=A0A8H3E5M0_9AGAM|nr:unnamed protein product [Rhizoctonia solani]CAE7183524.1 unnamed protein product [Rhizoctonia solani]
MPNRNKTRYEFGLTPVHINNIPPLNVLLEAANALLASTVRWPPGKTYYDGLVQTFSHKEASGPNWHGRLSYHPIEHGTFHEFWEVIGTRHCQAQEEYVPELVSAAHLEPYLEGDYNGWTYHYSYSPPMSPRTFTVLLATSLDDKPPRQGWVINIPFDVGDNEGLKALEEKGVRGRFTSVDRLLEVDGKVEWIQHQDNAFFLSRARAAMIYQIGGSIPNFISERGMPRQLAERVGQVIEYMAARREGQTGRRPKLVSRSSSQSIIKRAKRRSMQALTSIGAGASCSAPNTPESAATRDGVSPTAGARPSSAA